MKFWTWILAHKTLSIIVAVILSATLVTTATLLVIHTRPIESENVGGGAVTTTTTTDVTSTTTAADTTTSTDSSTTSTSTDGSSTTSGTGTTTTTVKGVTTTTAKGATTGTTKTPTTKATVKPTAAPTTKATVKPTAAPTTKATAKPTAAPTTKTTAKPTTTTTKKVTTTTTKPPVLNTCPNGWQNEASGHFMLCGKCSWCVANTMSLQEAEDYANAYLQELGFVIDYSYTPDGSGFMPPMTWDVGDDFETMKWHIKYQVDITISHRGLVPGDPLRAVAAYRPNEYDNVYGWLYILH